MDHVDVFEKRTKHRIVWVWLGSCILAFGPWGLLLWLFDTPENEINGFWGYVLLVASYLGFCILVFLQTCKLMLEKSEPLSDAELDRLEARDAKKMREDEDGVEEK